ncbi:MAG: HipA N-terminal domain-containing protein, partial [Betaproteobacteria bacterium]|nr:HipA N-terminal domain-containing protein [Betaproteobacteria bacterium]
MIRPQTDTSALDVLLHDKSVGTLIQHADQRLRFMFNERYTADARPAVLSLSFKAADGSLLPGSRSSRGRAPAFFANLLPEGSLRTYIAKQSKISTHDEFMLLWLLGTDLPGAVKLQADNDRELEELLATRPASAGTTTTSAGARLRFSLAGVQMKFSAQLQESDRFTLPATGRGGSWIIKLPAPQYPHLVENEFAMMQLAGTVGIQVPETRIVATGYIDGLPAGPWQDQQLALAIRR